MIRILIVEDEKPIARLMDWNLSACGYQCRCVHDGLEAADLILENSYDLILLDVMLPGADGYSLMNQIRPTGTPVIFITAKSSVADRVQGFRPLLPVFFIRKTPRYAWVIRKGIKLYNSTKKLLLVVE